MNTLRFLVTASFVSALVILSAARSPAALAATSTITYYHNDITGSPVAATNAAKQVVWRESYRPYGERTQLEAASVSNEIWFTSRKEDARTELVYLGARWYDPRIGRFLATDPVRFDGGNVHTFNLYAYANNSPYKYRDPDGRRGVLVVGEVSFALATRLGARELGGALGIGIGGLVEWWRGSGNELARPILNEAEPPDPSSANEKDPADKSGELTKAGRAQQKHGDRDGSAFDPARGTPEDKNKQGEETVCCIANSPTRTDEPNRLGGTDVRERPDGRGARFDRDGKFTGFIEPRRQ